MKIVKLEPTVRDPSRVRLTFDEGPGLTVPATLVADHCLYTGKVLDETEAADLQQAVRKANARQRAVRIVSATSVSRRELESRLIRKGEDADDAREAVQWLEDLGAVNDGDMARRVARQAAAKGYGKSRIRQVLYQKGIPRDLWDQALEDLPEPDDAIDRFLSQRLRGQWPDEKTLKKTTDALCRRGHSWEDIRRALSRYKENLENLEPEAD
jgi:regulatory protein